MVSAKTFQDVQDVPDLPGVQPELHHTLKVRDSFGDMRRWHYLDNERQLAERGIEPRGTLLCVHGSPTYSFLYRSLFNEEMLEAGWRVVAVDQLEMGYSERTGRERRLQDRITDLSLFTDALGLSGNVVTVGHDWGGIVSIGWALDNRHDVIGMVLTNTAIHQELGESLPASLQLATAPGFLPFSTSRTDAFLRTTVNLSKPPLPREVREGYYAPYRSRARRRGIETFVADIPASAEHPSRATLERLAEGLKGMDVPTLMVWGPRDVVFSDRYLRDLLERVPHADVHRFEGASHLVWDDAPVAPLVRRWLEERLLNGADHRERSVSSFAEQPEYRRLGSLITERANDPTTAYEPAVVEMLAEGPRTITWSLLEKRVAQLASGMCAHGIKAGDRVSVLVTPGADLTAVLYACLRIGAIAVVADAGLGVKGLTRAIVGAHIDYVVGIPTALAGARALGWPGERISVRTLPTIDRAVFGVSTSIDELMREGEQIHALGGGDEWSDIDPDADALVLFTSGSTGPAKGAVYTHRQASAMFAAVGDTLQLRPERGLVAGFAPFALLGPALGAPSIVPEMDVTRPGELTASALADAVDELGSPAVFTAPAALQNIIDTAGALDERQREALSRVPSFFSAGAPIPAPLLRVLRDVLPNAHSYSPYGMTECLAVAAIDLEGIEAAGEGSGVCVGAPVPRVELAIAPLESDGRAASTVTTEPGVVGEIMVRAAHVRDRYLMLWDTTRESMRCEGYHATGDVGQLDAEGRLWVEGRLAHVVTTAAGPVTPVQIEKAAESLEFVRRAGVCGVGPAGTQQVVVVYEDPATFRPGKGETPKPATPERQAAIREAVEAATGIAVTAAFETTTLPTDIRHNSKIERARLGAWATRELAGQRSAL